MKTLLTGIALLLSASAAVAQVAPEPSGGAILWGDYLGEILTGIVLPLMGTVVTAIVGWLAALATKKFGLDIESRHRESLQKAIENAAGLVLQALGNRTKGLKIDVKSKAVAEAVNYVLASAPDALAYFGLGGAGKPATVAEKAVIAEKVAAKVGVMTAAPPPVEVVSVVAKGK